MDNAEEVDAKLAENLPLSVIDRHLKNGIPFYTIHPNRLVDLCNSIFGSENWHISERDLRVEHSTQQDDGFKILVSIVVRLTLSTGVYHEDIGYGSVHDKDLETAKSKAIEWARNSGFIRCARQFGNALGNCLSKEYIDQIERENNPDYGI